MLLFHYWWKNFRARFLGVSLLAKSVFLLSWKKVRFPVALFLSVMNYKFAKNFFVFYENLQFPSSRPVLEGKFEIIWKNQKTMFLLKKFFFSSIKYSRGIRRSPGDTIKVFHPPMGGEMMKTLTLINLGSKSRFYYISQNGPIFGSETHEDLSTVIF